ncbi:hypothetical protein, partial [Aporhodopirellula aestuarii]
MKFLSVAVRSANERSRKVCLQSERPHRLASGHRFNYCRIIKVAELREPSGKSGPDGLRRSAKKSTKTINFPRERAFTQASFAEQTATLLRLGTSIVLLKDFKSSETARAGRLRHT